MSARRTAPAITGVWGTLLPSFDEQDNIDWLALETQIDRLLVSGVHGIYSNGTAGEFFAQTEDEFLRISTLLAAKCAAAGLPFQIGCSHMDAWVTLARVKKARMLAPTAIQIILPDWLPPTTGEQIAFLDRIADSAAPVPLVLYNPPHAKTRPSLAALGQLADRIPAVVGFKLPGGDAAWHDEMRRQIGHLSVFVPGHALATGMSAGASGSYSNIAALNPGAARRWYDQMQTDMPAALAVESRLQAFLRDHMEPLRDASGLSNPALDKLLCWIGGWTPIALRLRWPYAGAGPDQADALRAIAARDLPEFVT